MTEQTKNWMMKSDWLVSGTGVLTTGDGFFGQNKASRLIGKQADFPFAQGKELPACRQTGRWMRKALLPRRIKKLKKAVDFC